MAFTAEAYVELLKARMVAIQALADKQVDDSLFHWARFSELQARSQSPYFGMSSAGAPSGLTIPTIDELASRSCLTLVTLLGLGLSNPGDETAQLARYPAVWKAHDLRTIVHGELVGAGIQITVEVRPVEKVEGVSADQ
jgi:hypothetical protein